MKPVHLFLAISFVRAAISPSEITTIGATPELGSSAPTSASTPIPPNQATNGTLSNHLLAPRPICTDGNWSNASAWWFLVTLALGCLAHPRGSVVFKHVGRLWRISPLFLVIEDVIICVRLFQGMRRRRFGRSWEETWERFRICSYALLALREGNSWTGDKHDKFDVMWLTSKGEDEELLPIQDGDVQGGTATGNDAHSNSIRMRTWSSNAGHHNDGGTSSLRGPRSSTLEAEEGRIQHSAVSPTRITEEPLTAEPTEPQQEQISTLQLADETKSDTICRLKARYLWTLDKVQEFEKGPIYRCLLWFPIIQQTFKAVFVRGAPFTHVLGSIFIISFLLVEIPHFSARKPLSKEGRREAQELMTKWDQDSKLQTLAALGSFCSFILNAILFSRVFAIPFRPWAWLSNPFVGDLWALEWWEYPITVPLGFVTLAVEIMIMVFILMMIAYCVLHPWIFPLWWIEQRKNDTYLYNSDNEEVAVHGLNLTAIESAFIALVAYGGFVNGAKITYDCSNTVVIVSFFDWKG